MAGKKVDDRRSDTIHGAKTAQEAVDKLNELFEKGLKTKYGMPNEF
jgi:hypothetical protein